MKKALIFGADGFVGRYLARELMNHEYDVYGCSRGTKKLDGTAYCSYYFCDILDYDRVKTVILEVNPDIIINLAGISNVGLSWRIPQRVIEVNVCGGINILEVIRQYCPETRLLLIGSSEEYARSKEPLVETDGLSPNNPYGISKLTLEGFADIYRQGYGVPVYFVRSFNHTGIGQSDHFVIPSWCRQIAEISIKRSNNSLTVGNVDIIRDFSDVRDVVKAYRMIIESDDPSIIYNVGSGVALPLRSILEYIVSLADIPIMVEVDENLLRPSEYKEISCDNSRLRNILGWMPGYDIFDSCREIYEYYYRFYKERVGVD